MTKKDQIKKLINSDHEKQDWYKFICPSINQRAIVDKDSFRVKVASEESKKYTKRFEKVRLILREEGTYTNIECDAKNYLLNQVEVKTKEILEIISRNMKIPDEYNCLVNVDDICTTNGDKQRWNYQKYFVKNKIDLRNPDDFIWMKINEDGCISVVGVARDISFSDKNKSKTSAGRINMFLNEKWDEGKIFIFPLINIPQGLNRSDIESAVGNYLISCGIPILDYYSHIY